MHTTWKFLEEPCPLLICKTHALALVGLGLSYDHPKFQAQCKMPDNCGNKGCNIVKHSAVYKPLYKPGSSNRGNNG